MRPILAAGRDNSVNHKAPSGPVVIQLGEVNAPPIANSSITPVVVMRPILSPTLSVNHSAENGNRGTDHGHANVMFVLGGPVRGGRVYGAWPGLDPSQLNEGRDLALTTDFRRVLGESVSRHLGNAKLNNVFPGYDNSPHAFLRSEEHTS